MAFQGDSIFWVEVEKIVPNPFQPRREFDEHKLKELAESIRMYGILQPLTVTRREHTREDGTFYSEYELIAGERRLRASKLAGLTQVPVIIRDGEQTEQEKLELAIIENLQREDLNAVDRALAFRQLSDMFGLSHQQVAQKVGRSREYVSNTIRLLALPQHMLDALKAGQMSEGHARTLLMLSDRPEEQEVVFKEILLKKLSVREVERIARRIATERVRKREFLEEDADIIEMEKKFMETLGTRVSIQKTEFGGKLTIDYFSVADLEDMLRRIKLEQAEATSADSAAKLTAHTPLVVGAAAAVVTAAAPSVPVDVARAESLSGLYEHESEAAMEVLPESVPVLEPVVDAVPTPAPAYVPPVPAMPQPAPEPVMYSAPAPAPTVSAQPAPAYVAPAPMAAPVEPPVAPQFSTGVPEVAPAPAPVAPAYTPVVAPTPTPTPTPAPTDSDESDLYSIRNFGV